MNDYIDVRITLDPCTEDMTDVLAAVLADAGFESFVADDSGMNAFIRADRYEQSMESLTTMLPFHTEASWTATLVEGRDWNSEWEKHYFKPIVVADQVAIHSSFHTDVPSCRYDIVIDPKMAFGTGHHQTTWLMISSLLKNPPVGQDVVDMGTGTGILAILSMMLGASSAVGIEIDRPAYLNAIENINLNNTPSVRLINSDASALSDLEGSADLFLANINRNVITIDMASYSSTLRAGGRMLLSGFYLEDIDIVMQAAERYGLEKEEILSRDNWACLHLVKKSDV